MKRDQPKLLEFTVRGVHWKRNLLGHMFHMFSAQGLSVHISVEYNGGGWEPNEILGRVYTGDRDFKTPQLAALEALRIAQAAASHLVRTLDERRDKAKS